MKKIKLYWCRSDNFGDEIGPYILSYLTGKKVVYRDVQNRKMFYYVWVIYDVLKRLVQLKPLMLDRLYLVFNGKVILTAGSILNVSKSNCIVWGSGIIQKNDFIRGGDFRAVRGKISQKRLEELGHKTTKIFGDPALLLPLIYKPKVNKKYFLGVIPHVWDYDEFHKLIDSQKDILLINLRNNVEHVIDEINSCERIISTSLHGLIVSHAYGIPAIWFTNGNIGGDNIKFEDYFSSVGIHNYNPYSVHDKNILNKNEVSKLFEECLSVSIPNRETIIIICKNLLLSAPFEIKKGIKLNYKYSV